MVVDIRKSVRKKFYEPQTVGAEYVKAGFHEHLEVASRMSVRLKAKANFIIAGVSGGSFTVLEMKRGTGQLGARQISAYLRMPVAAGGLYILPFERKEEQGRILVHEDIETLPELVKAARPIEISYFNQALVETLLDNKGKRTLEKVLSLIKSSATELDWPLARVEIRYVRDPEVKDWEYVLLLLVFTCDFDTADRHLHKLYDQIDMLSSKLSDDEKEILRRVIFFDIEAKASISSA
jgi:hypothetical protein